LVENTLKRRMASPPANPARSSGTTQLEFAQVVYKNIRNIKNYLQELCIK
jgi:hypothetical protein